MEELRIEEFIIKSRHCHKVYWRNIAIGLIFEESPDQWRYSTELKGEFWSLDTFADSIKAADCLLDKRRKLDEYRLSRLK